MGTSDPKVKRCISKDPHEEHPWPELESGEDKLCRGIKGDPLKEHREAQEAAEAEAYDPKLRPWLPRDDPRLPAALRL